MMNHLALNDSQKKILKWLLIWLFALSWCSMKLSLPVLPVLVNALHTRDSLIKLSVSVYFTCYAASQIAWGALSEKYGRRSITLIALMIAGAGALTSTFCSTLHGYLIGRALEGMGIGAISSIGRAILADVFERKVMAKIMTIVSLFTGLMPALAPIAGGFILAGLGWRAVFAAFFILLLPSLIVTYFTLPETFKNNHRNSSLLHVFFNYKSLIMNRHFWAIASSYALAQGFLLGYYAAMPFWYVAQFHINEQHYAFLALVSVGVYVTTLMVIRRLIDSISLEKLIRIALAIGVAAAGLLCIFAVVGIHGVLPIVIVMGLFAIVPGITSPCVSAVLMKRFSSEAAMVSALTATFMFFMAAVFSYLESRLNVTHLGELATLMLITSVFAFWAQNKSVPTANNFDFI